MLAFFFIGILVLLAADQISKLIVLNTLTEISTVPLWDGVFHLTYVENRGAAFGILQDKLWLFAVITVIVVAGVVVFMVKKRPKERLVNWSLTLLIGGALGNFIDRIFRGFVVDFIDFRLINFPVFNLADCFVVIGAVLLAFYLIFVETKKEQRHAV